MPTDAASLRPRKRSRRTFVLGLLATVGLMLVGASIIGIHAAESALNRANSYEKFDDFMRMRESWRITSFVATAGTIGFLGWALWSRHKQR